MSRGRHTAPSLTATATATRPRFGEAWTPRPALVTTFAPQPVPQREPRSWEVVRRPSEKVYRPGLDGLRAIAVIGVLLYHAGVSWMPGGLLGVDLFFVISGFLITSLLVAELQRSGSIAMVAFYRRRARRLLPALAAVLAFTLVGMALVRPGDLVRFGSDVLASIGYVTNWWFVVQHRSYFVASGRPSPFQHLWSLAVEEQFYILWPLALLVLWRVLTRAKSLAGARGRTASRSLARIGRYAVGAACISAGWMAYIAVRENLPYGADTSRVYFGTDTHASGLLLGVAAAAFLAAWYGPLWQQRPGRMGRAAFDLAGTAALAAAGWAMFRTNEFSPGLYRGGFLAFAAAAAVAVTAISRPGAVLEKVLGSKPARWVGTRSYGLYLWHWPVFVYTRPQLDVPLTGTANVLLRLALTVALAETSFRLVEQPIRTLGLRTWLQQVLHHAQTTARGASIRHKAARWPCRRSQPTRRCPRHITRDPQRYHHDLRGTATDADPVAVAAAVAGRAQGHRHRGLGHARRRHQPRPGSPRCHGQRGRGTPGLGGLHAPRRPHPREPSRRRPRAAHRHQRHHRPAGARQPALADRQPAGGHPEPARPPSVARSEQHNPCGRRPQPSRRQTAGLERGRIGASGVAVRRRDPSQARRCGRLPGPHPQRTPTRRVNRTMRQTGNATRQPAVLVAILLTMVLATGGCSIRGASSSAVPVSTIAPTQGQTEAVQPPLPASPTPGAARSSVPAIRRPKQGWEPDWRVQQTPAATVPARPMQGGSDITAVGDSNMVDALPNL